MRLMKLALSNYTVWPVPLYLQAGYRNWRLY